MPIFHLAWRSAGPAEPALFDAASGLPLAAPAPLTAATRLAVRAAGAPAALELLVDPPALTLTAVAVAPTLHYFRLADATVKPLPATPPPLSFQPGDTYLAVTPAAGLAASQPGGASAALARFIHLRDYFNADKLAAAVLDHLLELGHGPPPQGTGILVVELR